MSYLNKVSEGSSSSSKKKKYVDFRTSKNITAQDYVDDRDRVMRLWNEHVKEYFPNMESEVDELIKRRAENKSEPTIYEKVLSIPSKMIKPELVKVTPDAMKVQKIKDAQEKDFLDEINEDESFKKYYKAHL